MIILQEWLVRLTEFAVPMIDLMALIIIAAATIEAFISCVGLAFSRDSVAGRLVWMRYSRWLVAGLTFQLAADIIETSLTPSWDDIGQLAAIAVIRTFLNYFLERDQSEMRERMHETEKPAER